MKMNFPHCFILITLARMLSLCQFNAQSGTTDTSSARSLDTLLQDYAYQAFDRPRTGVTYTADVPSKFSGVTLSVVRLRSGSLRHRGIKGFYEFDIPVGIVATPYVARLALVYQNLGNWSTTYYAIPGYTLVSPVIGLLVYNASYATKLSAKKLPELDMVATVEPMSINFENFGPFPRKEFAKCAYFYLNGTYQIKDVVSGDICTTFVQGHFTLAVNSTHFAPVPSQGPSGPRLERATQGESGVWKIVVGSVGGLSVLILLVLLAMWLLKYRKRRKITHMMKHSETGELLKTRLIGNAKLPVANLVRTQPIIENEYVP